eukprot:5259741-Amphidinium_carterae.1
MPAAVPLERLIEALGLGGSCATTCDGPPWSSSVTCSPNKAVVTGFWHTLHSSEQVIPAAQCIKQDAPYTCFTFAIVFVSMIFCGMGVIAILGATRSSIKEATTGPSTSLAAAFFTKHLSERRQQDRENAFGVLDEPRPSVRRPVSEQTLKPHWLL